MDGVLVVSSLGHGMKSWNLHGTLGSDQDNIYIMVYMHYTGDLSETRRGKMEHPRLP